MFDLKNIKKCVNVFLKVSGSIDPQFSEKLGLNLDRFKVIIWHGMLIYELPIGDTTLEKNTPSSMEG